MNCLDIPKHIAIIMDGNGRWAKKHALPRRAGHVAGAKAIKPIVIHCNKIGVELLTLYAFSTENWNRPKDEVDSLLKLIRHYINNMYSYIKYNVKIRFFGDLRVFDQQIIDKMKQIEEEFDKNTGMTFGIAINYGGKDEIKNAAKEIARKVTAGELKLGDIKEKTIEEHLYTKGFSNVDLLIRPSGEYRISNFLIWQSAYAEFLFMENILWPDFKTKHIDIAIEEYNKRNRTYGSVK